MVTASHTPRRAEVLGDTLRRFIRRGSGAHLRNLLGKVRPEDVASVLPRFTPGEQLQVFEFLRHEFQDAAGEVLVEVEPEIRHTILQALTAEEIGVLLQPLAVDDAVGLVESVPADLKDEVLALIEHRDYADVQEQLTYEDDSAGRIMDPELFSLLESQTVRDAIAGIQSARDVAMIFYVYVVDKERHLVGVASLRQLLLAQPDRTLGEIMNRSVIKVDTDTDQEEVAKLAARYNLLAIPVTDDRNRLMGIVTVDDIIDVVEEEATEDFYKMVGTSDDELMYQEHALRVAWIRFPWLAFNLVGLVASGFLLEHFQVTLREALFLLVFVPMIMGMGGNIGSQTSTIAVRGLATGNLGLGDRRVSRFLMQQVKVGTILGLVFAGIVAVVAVVQEQNPYYGAVVGTSLFFAMTLASFNGALIPVLFERLGIDPAVAAGPLVTTLNDLSGILIYFGLASVLIETLVR